MLKSNFLQYLKTEGMYGIKEYLEQPNLTGFSFDNLKYHYLIAHYQKMFGKGNVLVLPFELLKKDPNHFMTRICQHISIDSENIIRKMNFEEKVNKNISSFALRIKRYLNPFILKSLPNIGKTLYFWPIHAFWALLRRLLERLPTGKLDKEFENKIEDIINRYTKDKYNDSNKLTSELIGYDLSKFGYD